ncbi:Uncharacterised protein [Corynebacterium renale]|uniref:Uncharacterized protein n=1 Tax=Corynebacterium renale TaxID=1724 RepID=A0A2A9DMZ7_9CORY|nr:hypothetical protein ATK06_0333 [Corynebacterium renale]SQI23635.1 Uncharacterised protein [Corynebacterium renale]
MCGVGHARIAARDTKKTFCQLVRIKPQGEFSQKVAECLFRITAGSCVFREGAAWGEGLRTSCEKSDRLWLTGNGRYLTLIIRTLCLLHNCSKLTLACGFVLYSAVG